MLITGPGRLLNFDDVLITALDVSNNMWGTEMLVGDLHISSCSYNKRGQICPICKTPFTYFVVH